MKTAFIFPGQGSQFVGMGKDLFDSFDIARDVFQRVDAVTGENISSLCFNGPVEELSSTRYCQLAILATSLACLRVIESQGNIQPCLVAGHSLGEYTALVCAGAIDMDDAFRVVQKRAMFMHQASIEYPGGMAAVLGLDEEDTTMICQKAVSKTNEDEMDEILEIANLNCPGQIVITGTNNALDRGMELCKKAGAKRAIKLAVSGGFHSSLMNKASEQLRQVLDGVQIRDVSCPIVVNVDASARKSGDELKDCLVKQVNHSVLWEASVRYMVNHEIGAFVEIGPGKVLSGLNKRIYPGIRVMSVDDVMKVDQEKNYADC